MTETAWKPEWYELSDGDGGSKKMRSQRQKPAKWWPRTAAGQGT